MYISWETFEPRSEGNFPNNHWSVYLKLTFNCQEEGLEIFMMP